VVTGTVGRLLPQLGDSVGSYVPEFGEVVGRSSALVGKTVGVASKPGLTVGVTVMRLGVKEATVDAEGLTVGELVSAIEGNKTGRRPEAEVGKL
jgi:hypothetical protein